MRFGSIGYNLSTFIIITLLISYTMVMTFFISDQKGIEMSTMLILYTNVVFICVMIQMNVSSKMS
tara:strand:+ start:15664 stop:15858 length:195 start_codon:yes stop_codon:yes gene_type:complete